VLHHQTVEPDIDRSSAPDVANSLQSFRSVTNNSAFIGDLNNGSSIFDRIEMVKFELDKIIDDSNSMKLLGSEDHLSVWTFLNDTVNSLRNELENVATSSSSLELKRDLLYFDVYDRNYKRPSVSTVCSTQSTIESRMDALEKLTGVCASSVETSDSISSRLINLENKLKTFKSLFEQQRLSSKLNATKGELEIMTAKIIQNQSLVDIINSAENLNSSLGHLDGVASVLPHLSSRLRTLEAIHWAASCCVQKLNDVESGLSTLEETSKLNRELISQMTLQLNNNIGTFQENVRRVDERLATLEGSF